MSRKSFAGVTSNRVYIGNIPWSTTANDIRVFFDAFIVKRIWIIHDRATKRPKGYAFVELENAEEAALAIAQLNKLKMGDREILVRVAEVRLPSTHPSRAMSAVVAERALSAAITAPEEYTPEQARAFWAKP